MNGVIADAAAFGFTNVTSACLSDPSCTPDSYLFWDGVHPTTAGAAMLGDEFTGAVAPVPEPASLLLFGSGLVGAMRAVRRGRR